MTNNPYKVLGVPDGATEEECTKAYKRLAKKYHPDLNPNDKSAERKMAEINAAYDAIKNQSAKGSTSSYYDYSSSRGSQSSASSSPDYLSSAAQFIRTGQYQQAINLLNNIDDREDAHWNYLYALANMALGNTAVAQEHIRTAVAKQPDNYEYEQAYRNIINGINPLDFNPFSVFFDFSDSDNSSSNTSRGYTAGRGGCLSRIIRIILIIFIIRLIFYLISSVAYRRNVRYYNSNPSHSYSQQYDGDDILGENHGKNSNM